MTTRATLLKSLAGVAGLLALMAAFLSFSPPPVEPESPVSSSRELDETAEEVRAAATGMRRLERKILDQAERTRKLSESLDALRARVERLARRDPNLKDAPAARSAPSLGGEESHGERAFDLSTLTHEPPAAVAADFPETPVSTRLSWVEPVDGGRLLRRGMEMVSDDLVPGERIDERTRFHIPPSILAGVSLTALVGRIPRGGAVRDPWPFVVVSQADNLTANGVRLPQLRGILWRGVVRGDAVLSCASASIRSLVYVFDDGTFHVAKAPEREGFGYLADKSGNPCLSGEIRTTAPEDMSRHLLAGVLAGAGGAFAESQVRRDVEGDVETTRVEGDAFRYLLGQTVQGAATAYGDFLRRFANDTWDAVVVPAGRDVDIHITDAIAVVHSPSRTIHDHSISPRGVSLGGLD